MREPAEKLVVRHIHEEEHTQVSIILEEASLWLMEKGQPMWTESQYSVHGLLNRYRSADMCLGFIGQQAVAAMILPEQKPSYWPDDSQPSLYLHKLAVRRSYSGTGVAAGMVAWAIEQAALRGKYALRLDCASDRSQLCAFYEKQGFVKLKETLLYNQYPTAFYEISTFGMST
ncbi:GNAT family N-acetyltransferase [Paenibacillus koleovorans]|uniref:GNAT family N-acetyltransferase n=1 Tax=Paenibacillus koleovorans TaxID=121608 RepID=UPI000FD6BC87|nr:GNAT family N-acetyltransferase [Paenibacillus koleovorans]